MRFFHLAASVTSGMLLMANIFAQSDSTASQKKMKFLGFADAYYSYDINTANNTDRGILINYASPFYNHTAHNHIAVNNILAGVKYEHEIFRLSGILQYGTFVQKNYAAEPASSKYIYEALAGIKLIKGLWLEAGIFTSHIGLESAISIDNYVLTRSLSAENTPYFESGAKLTYTTPDDKWLFSGLVLNGWQNIQAFQRAQKAWGTQVKFKPFGEKLILNSSTYFGPAPVPFVITDKSGSVTGTDMTRGGEFLMRYFHNFYIIYEVSPKLTVAFSFDAGFQEKSSINKTLGSWFNPTFLVKYELTSRLAVNGRLEHYNDPTGIVIPTGTAGNFVATGASLGLDFAPLENVKFRIEARSIKSIDKIFINQQQGKGADLNTFFTTSIAVKVP